MKIIITNVYCYKNKGDAGIVVSMIKSLKKTFPHSDIKIVSLYPKDDVGKYDEDVTILEPLIPKKKFKSKFIKLL